MVVQPPFHGVAATGRRSDLPPPMAWSRAADERRKTAGLLAHGSTACALAFPAGPKARQWRPAPPDGRRRKWTRTSPLTVAGTAGASHPSSLLAARSRADRLHEG